MNLKKWFAIVLLIGLVIGIGVFFWSMNKSHRDYSGEEAVAAVQSHEIHSLFLEDEPFANEKYLDQIVIVEGTITDINAEYVVLDDFIICSMDEGQEKKVIEIGQGKIVQLKGRCVSWDSLFEEVRLDHVTFVSGTKIKRNRK